MYGRRIYSDAEYRDALAQLKVLEEAGDEEPVDLLRRAIHKFELQKTADACKAGWSSQHLCETGDVGCTHYECDGCGASEMSPPGAPVPRHDCPDPLTAAHKRSSNHRDEILASEVCGCFHCAALFAPTAIKEWIDAQQTALCPRCGIDSVIGGASGLLVLGFLEAMHQRWMTPKKE